MRHAALALLVVGGACTTPADRGAGRRAEDVTAIRQLYEELMAVHRAGDATRWAGLFTSDGMFLADGAPTVTGTDALADWIGVLYDTYQIAGTIEPLEIEVVGDWAFARDRFTLTLTPRAGGPAVTIDGKEIVILRRQRGGSWKVARVIVNSNRPAGGGS